MKITPELVAKLIFASSQLRYFEQQCMIDPNPEMHDIVRRYQCKVDEVLCLMGVDMYMPLNTLLQTIKISNNEHSKTEHI